MRFGGLEVVFVFAIVLLFFGPKQIPKLTSVLKDSIASFKEGAGKEKDAEFSDNATEIKSGTEGEDTVAEG